MGRKFITFKLFLEIVRFGLKNKKLCSVYSFIMYTFAVIAITFVSWINLKFETKILNRKARLLYGLLHPKYHSTAKKKGNISTFEFNDVKYKDQWYLHNTGQTGGPAGIDINVLPVWKSGITGKGVVISIIDDGVDYTHPDLRKNYDPRASYDFEKKIFDSTPNEKNWVNAHGTRCAGEIAAQANNKICGVGVAYNSRIGGIKLLSINMNDSYEAYALSFHNNYIDIYSNSWGPKDDGKSYGKPGKLSAEALRKGITYGRNGKGCIYVWATGNGGLMDDDCNCDGYVASIYTVSIGSISNHGLSVYYKESCASTLAVTFSGGSHREKEENKIITTDINGECTDHFRGTSSAAPIAAGIIALALEANPKLSWRDVQHLIVRTATVTSSLDVGWRINGAGHHFNHKFGFGKLDAQNLVYLAHLWKNVQPQKVCHAFKIANQIVIGQLSSITLHVPTDGCASKKENYIEKLEHVVLRVSYQAKIRGAISIGLTSPMKTRSQLLSRRKRDIEENAIEDWDYMTVFNWDESPKGTWIIDINDYSQLFNNNKTETLNSGNLIVDEEDLTRNIMDDENQKSDNSKKSTILFMKRIKRNSEDIEENISIDDTIFTKLELIFYGT